MEETESRVEVYVTTDTSGAPHKAGEPKLYVMYDAAKPEAGRLYFTEAEWDAFVLGVKDGEFDLDEDGNLPPVPPEQQQQRVLASRQRSGFARIVRLRCHICLLGCVGQCSIRVALVAPLFSSCSRLPPSVRSRSSPS